MELCWFQAGFNEGLLVLPFIRFLFSFHENKSRLAEEGTHWKDCDAGKD